MYGGSTAARTIGCPSWVDLAKTLPKTNQSSSYAQEGTALHQCMQDLLEGDREAPAEFLGCMVEGVLINTDHIEMLEMALNAWDELCRQYGIEDYLTEQTFELTPEIGDTADVTAWNVTQLLTVDWKFGQGVEVDAEGNAQGLFYPMCGEYDRPDVFHQKQKVVAIIQPMPSRSEHQTLKAWDVPEDLFEAFKQTYHRALQSKGFNGGDHCKFCPAAAMCPEKTGEAHRAMLIEPDKIENLKEALDLAFKLEDWIRQVKSFGHDQLDLGTQCEGYKLVAKRATRKWTDPDEVEKLVRANRKVTVTEMMQPHVLKSPAQMEKLFKSKKLDFAPVDEYITQVSSGNTLVKESDKREGVVSATALAAALKRLS
jgi:hypothetical protein